MGWSNEQRLVRMLIACVKRINEFTKISKNHKLEADLIAYTLKIPFAYPQYLSSFYANVDYRVGLLLKRLITIVTKKLHEDYLIEYRETINGYLKVLGRRARDIEVINNLPSEI